MQTQGDHSHDDGEADDHELLFGPEPKDMITAHGDDSYRFYAYRPRELLVASHVAARVREELERRVGPVSPVRGVGTMVKYRLPAPYAAEDLLSDLRSVLGDTRRASISVNTVLSLGGHGRLHCPHPPQPVAKPVLEPADPQAGYGIRVAIIDTGVAKLDEDFECQIERRPNGNDPGFDVPDEDPDSSMLGHAAGHGTFAAGLILQNAPKATVVSLRRVETEGVIDDWALAEALVEVAELDGPEAIHVVSLSLGGHTPDDMGLPATAEALRVLFAAHPDTVVVAAAGNDTVDRPFFPAAYKQVIAVGAVDRDEERAWFSNYGWWVDACAPGIDVISTFLNKRDFNDRSLTNHRLPEAGPQSYEGWACWSGSSFTAPQVAGAIAARKSAQSTGRGPAFRGPVSVPTLVPSPASVPELGTLVSTSFVLKPPSAETESPFSAGETGSSGDRAGPAGHHQAG